MLTVQEGLNSGTVPQGRLMRESEQLIADFQRDARDTVADVLHGDLPIASLAARRRRSPRGAPPVA